MVWLVLYTFLCTIGVRVVISAKSCGSVTSTIFINTSTSEAEIRLEPNVELMFLNRIGWHRWYFYRKLGNNTVVKIIDTHTSFNLDINKYSDDNFVLRIRNLTPYDSGKYFVNCWVTEKQCNSETTNIDIPETTTKTVGVGTTTSPLLTGAKSPNNTTNSLENLTGTSRLATIVVALSVVVVVVVVAFTVIIVYKRRQRSKDGDQILVNKDESSGFHASLECRIENTESVYNEIEIVDDFAYAERIPNNLAKSTQSLVLLSSSPQLPKRPDENSNAEYAQIVHEVNETCSKTTDKAPPTNTSTDNSSSRVVDNTESDNGEIEYAKVKPKSERPTTDNTKINENISIVVNTETADYVCPKTEYVVVFPKINYSKVNASLEQNNAKTSKERSLSRQGGPEYTNIQKRSYRRKSRRKDQDLTYIEIDHTGSMGNLHDESSIKLDPSEYSSIDFDKKAFVAPIRKAPSSWYKRKNKKKYK